MIPNKTLRIDNLLPKYQDVNHEVRYAISKQLRVDICHISTLDNFFKDLKGDLLDLIEIVTYLEKTLEKSIGDIEVKNIQTVADIINCFENTKKIITQNN